jgi:diguanylate cyclase (GGDEF)-like protein/PAS domain S-box-containing protein
LISLILLGLLPVFVLVIWNSLSEHNSDISASYEDTKRLARLAAAREGALIEGAHQLTIALSVLPAVVHRDQTTCNSFARNLLSAYPQYSNFGVVDIKGSVWCNGWPAATPENLGDRPYIRHALDRKEPSLGGYQIGRWSGLPSIVYARPIVAANGKSAGAAFASLRAGAFGVLGKDMDMPEGAVYLVIDHEGKILQRLPDGPHAQGTNISDVVLFRAALGQSSGSLETSGVDGIARIYGFAWSGADVNRSVLVAIGIPRELVVATGDRHALISILALLIVAAMTVLVGARASQRLILDPIGQLVNATRRIAAHEPNVRTHMRQRNELGELGRAVDEMAQSLEAQRVALKDSEARFRDLTELSSDWYWEQDEHFRFTDVSLEIATKTGFSASDHVGKTRWELPGITLPQAQWDRHIASLKAHKPFDGFTYQRTSRNGETRYFNISGQPVFDHLGRFKGYRGVGSDVTSARGAEERIKHLAYHDALTGLPNRASFSLMLDQAIARARRDGSGFAILFIDLDGFKQVNDTLGHNAGDALLLDVAHRLKACVRQNDIAARLGGDEYVVLLDNVSDPAQAAKVAEKMLLQIAATSQQLGMPHGVTASIGIGFYPHDGEDEKTLMMNADSAMYRAKQRDKNNFQFHSQHSSLPSSRFTDSPICAAATSPSQA